MAKSIENVKAINKNIKLEVGYMNQFFEKYSRDQLNIITFVNF